MRFDTNSAARLLQYFFRVIPAIRHLSVAMDDEQIPCFLRSCFLKNINSEPVTGFYSGVSALSAAYYALCPGTDYKSALAFIHNLFTLSEILEAYRLQKNITDEHEIRKLFGCLLSAVDPARNTICYLNTNLNDMKLSRYDNNKRTCLSDQCRLQLATLPSFSLVSHKLKKYMQLYIDFKAYSYYPETLRNQYFEAWSSSYLKCYRQITFWEFCAASSSLTGIAAMYSAASNPQLSKTDVILLDEVCFPWLCGFESLLCSYISDRICYDKSLKFTSFYNNLKACEERIIFFGSKAAEACMKLNPGEREFYLSYLKFLTVMFLSDSEADFGLKKISSRNIKKNLLDSDIFSYYLCKFLRMFYKL